MIGLESSFDKEAKVTLHFHKEEGRSWLETQSQTPLYIILELFLFNSRILFNLFRGFQSKLKKKDGDGFRAYAPRYGIEAKRVSHKFAYSRRAFNNVR